MTVATARPAALRRLRTARFYDMVAYLNTLRRSAGLPLVTFYGTGRDVLINHIYAAERGEFRTGPQTMRTAAAA